MIDLLLSVGGIVEKVIFLPSLTMTAIYLVLSPVINPSTPLYSPIVMSLIVEATISFLTLVRV